MKVVEIDEEKINKYIKDGRIWIVDLLKFVFKSNTMSRKYIKTASIKVNDVLINKINSDIKASDEYHMCVNDREFKLKVV